VAPSCGRATDRLVLVCAAVTRPPAPPPPPPPPPPVPAHPAAFDPKFIERFARGMAEGGSIIEELALRNNVNNPNYRSAFVHLLGAILISIGLPFTCDALIMKHINFCV